MEKERTYLEDFIQQHDEAPFIIGELELFELGTAATIMLRVLHKTIDRRSDVNSSLHSFHH